MRLSKVVLPAPRYPVSTVTGIFSGEVCSDIPISWRLALGLAPFRLCCSGHSENNMSETVGGIDSAMGKLPPRYIGNRGCGQNPAGSVSRSYRHCSRFEMPARQNEPNQAADWPKRKRQHIDRS